jgi:hypothetical protein
LPNKIRIIKSRRVRWTRPVTHGREEECIKVLVGKPEGKKPLGKSTCRWKDNIKMDLREIGWESIWT